MRRPALRIAALLGTLVAAVSVSQAASARPKLAVLIVVDQMRADYVQRFRADWTGGLKRLVTEGAWFRRTAYPYLNTVTCAGHATIATGAFPHTTGIFQNAWYDRDRRVVIPCTDDPESRGVSYGDKSVSRGGSASGLLLPTLADRLRTTRSAHVVSVSLKDRSAMMLAGHGGDAVIWLSDTLDAWQTSSAYASKPNDLVERYVKNHPIDDDYGKTWDRLLPAARYHGADDAIGEAPPRGWTRTFPHALTSASGKPDFEFRTRWERSPYGDAYVGRMAAALAAAFQLGTHGTTDVLAIGFSSPDLVGHAFGPDSQEVQDVFAYLDRTVGELFERLDALVGRDQYVVALSSDHGVTPIAEQMKSRGLDAGRFDVAAMSAALEQAVSEQLGPGRYVARFNGTDAYLASGVYDRLAETAGRLGLITSALAAMPGVARAFSADELHRSPDTSDALLRAAILSYVPGRSGDFVIAPKPGWTFATVGATHGTAAADDQRVPLLFLGRGVKRGEYGQPATPADLAPTLAAVCGVALPEAEGHALRQALK